ncbi:MAG: hypothetical protein ACTSR8_11150 [Promethearchaeota archaeon]
MSFTFISIIIFTANVNATNYDTNIQKDDEFIQEIKVLDVDSMKEVFGKERDKD